MTCPICVGAGYVTVKVLSSHQSHERRKGETEFAIVTVEEDLRWPCICAAGADYSRALGRPCVTQPSELIAVITPLRPQTAPPERRRR